MKHIIHSLVFSAVMVFAANVMHAETTTVTTSEGTITQFSPDTIVIKSTTSTDPLTYSYTKTTTYVDEAGNPVATSTIKSGVPVTVYYDKNGNKMVATKVVVKKATVIPPRG